MISKLDRNESLSFAKEILSLHYPGIDPSNITGYKKSNIFIVEGEGKQFILKRHETLLPSNLEILQVIYSICSRNGLVPLFVKSKDQKSIVDHSGVFFSLQMKMSNRVKGLDPVLLAQRVAKLHATLQTMQVNAMENHIQKSVEGMLSLAAKYGYGGLITIIKKVNKIVEDGPNQIIHGDLHVGNIIKSNSIYYFIDVDSANKFHPISDIAFSAFRIFGFDEKKIKKYIDSYNEQSNGLAVHYQKYMWHFVVYNILQRILFIKVQNDRGNSRWLYDLDNQERYLKDVIEYCNEMGSKFSNT